MEEIEIESGLYRRLTSRERREIRRHGKSHTVVVLRPYRLMYKDKIVSVPRGFLSDGSTYSPDIGTAWLYHDILYNEHKCWELRDESGDGTSLVPVECEREYADEVLIRVMREEGRWFLAWIYERIFTSNFLGKPGRSWIKAHRRGTELYEQYFDGGTMDLPVEI